MKLEYSQTESVPYDVAKGRVLDALPTHLETLIGKGAALPPAALADRIWPDHQMVPPGRGIRRGRDPQADGTRGADLRGPEGMGPEVITLADCALSWLRWNRRRGFVSIGELTRGIIRQGVYEFRTPDDFGNCRATVSGVVRSGARLERDRLIIVQRGLRKSDGHRYRANPYPSVRRLRARPFPKPTAVDIVLSVVRWRGRAGIHELIPALAAERPEVIDHFPTQAVHNASKGLEARGLIRKTKEPRPVPGKRSYPCCVWVPADG